jgi:hypothetical protein
MNATEQHLIESGLRFNQAGTHRLIIGEELPKDLATKKDLSINNATMKGLVNFIRSRASDILVRKASSHITVATRKSEITLVVGEHGGVRLEGENDRTPQITVRGSQKFSDDYNSVVALMGKKHPDPHQLGTDLRRMPHLFASVVDLAALVKKLRDCNVKIGLLKKDRTLDETSREQQMEAFLEDGKLDHEFNFLVPIFEGEERVVIPARAIYQVNEDFNGVEVEILDASETGGMVNQRREILKKMLETNVAEIEGILGANELPIVYID